VEVSAQRLGERQQMGQCWGRSLHQSLPQTSAAGRTFRRQSLRSAGAANKDKVRRTCRAWSWLLRQGTVYAHLEQVVAVDGSKQGREESQTQSICLIRSEATEQLTIQDSCCLLLSVASQGMWWSLVPSLATACTAAVTESSNVEKMKMCVPHNRHAECSKLGPRVVLSSEE
jgi:acyl-CoA synthetase (NDP forming)